MDLNITKKEEKQSTDVEKSIKYLQNEVTALKKVLFTQLALSGYELVSNEKSIYLSFPIVREDGTKEEIARIYLSNQMFDEIFNGKKDGKQQSTNENKEN